MLEHFLDVIFAEAATRFFLINLVLLRILNQKDSCRFVTDSVVESFVDLAASLTKETILRYTNSAGTRLLSMCRMS